MRAFLVLVLALSLSACTGRFVLLRDPYEIDHFLKAINEHNNAIEQIKAGVAIKGVGILGHLFHEQADVIIKKPHFLLWAMRSFFDSPASIIASNGEFITIYDWSGHRSATYEKMPISAHSLIDLFDFKIHPRFLIDLVLTRVPLEHARDVQINKKDGLFEYKAELDDQWRIRAVFEEARRVVLEMSLLNKDSELSYEVSYAEFSKYGEILFPTLYSVRANSAKNAVKFTMRVKRLDINGISVSPENFFLSPQ